MKKVLLFIVCVTSSIVLLGQTHSSADKLFQDGEYAAAQEAYGTLLKRYPTDALYLYRYARCAQELGNDTTAIKYFDKAGDRYKLKYFYLGESYMRLWHMEEAIEAYNTYLSTLKEPNERESYIAQQIAKAEKLQRYLRRIERLQVIDSVEVALDSMLKVCRLSAEAGNRQNGNHDPPGQGCDRGCDHPGAGADGDLYGVQPDGGGGDDHRGRCARDLFTDRRGLWNPKRESGS